MVHVAMVSTPFPGHVNPSLEVIRELVARGHRVTYANDPSYEDKVTAVGAEFVPYKSTLLGERAASIAPDDAVGQFDLFLDDSISMLPQLRAAYDGDRPDLLLYDITGYAGRLLAEEYGIPSMQLSPSAVAWEGYEEDMAETLDALRATPAGAEHYRRFTAWLEENGASDTDSTAFVAKPERGLVLIPRAMQPNAERVDPARFTFVGPALAPRDDQGGWDRPETAEKVLLISLGSTFTDQPDFYRECLAAFGDLPGWHVVLQIGKQVAVEDLGEVPGNVEVHRWVPQLAILEQADAFVTHAGSGGANEGLYCGVPMIAVPQAVDQFMNADQLVAAGVARRLDTADATADALREALQALTSDEQVAARLADIRRELREEGGTRRAADLIEALLP